MTSQDITSPSFTQGSNDRIQKLMALNPKKFHMFVYMSIVFMIGTAAGYGLSYVNQSWNVVNAIYGWNTIS